MKPQQEIEISKIIPTNEQQQRMAEISFECIVRMYDLGQINPPIGMFTMGKPLPPQWFKMQSKLTLEFIKHADEYAIGSMIKEAYYKLEKHISEYESK